MTRLLHEVQKFWGLLLLNEVSCHPPAEIGHVTKSIIPVSIPTVPQLRPVLEAISRGSSPIPPEQVHCQTLTFSAMLVGCAAHNVANLFLPLVQLLKASEQQQQLLLQQAGTGSRNLEAGPPESRQSPGRGVQQTSPHLHSNGSSSTSSLQLGSRSLTLKHGHRHSAKTQLPAAHGDVLAPQPGFGSPHHHLMANHTGLSYDGLVNPSEPHFLSQRGTPAVGYHFMTLGADGMVVQRPAPPTPHAYSPVFMGVARQSPQPRDPSPSLQVLTSRDPSPSFQSLIQRDPSPSFQGLMARDLVSQSVVSRDLTPPPLLTMRDVANSNSSSSLRDSLRDLGTLTPPKSAAARYDNFSKTIMASIQGRRELDERERMQLRLQARSQALYGPDAGVYDIPSRRSLPPDNLRAPAGSRGPTPPAYGSREFLMSTGILGYGMRTSPLSSSSTSSLTRGPRTSSSPLQSSSSSSLQTRGQSASLAYCTPDRQPLPTSTATATLPRLPSSSSSSTPSYSSYASYATAKRSSITHSLEGKDSATLGALNH